jgi:hypothetical protein
MSAAYLSAQKAEGLQPRGIRKKDAASEDACKAYGVGGVMHMPGRLHITWDADDTLKIETEAGAQTRLLAFGQLVRKAIDWQGCFRGNVGSARGGS